MAAGPLEEDEGDTHADGLITLLGDPLPAYADLFVDAPVVIGRVVRAASEAGVTTVLLPLALRIAGGVASALYGLAASVWIWRRWSESGVSHVSLELFILSISLPVGMGIWLLWSAVQPTWIAYIGTEGIAIFRTFGTRAAATGQWAIFDEVADVRINRRPAWKGGLRWSAHFLDHDRRVLIRLGGRVKLTKYDVEYSTPHVFASVAERIWHERQDPDLMVAAA